MKKILVISTSILLLAMLILHVSKSENSKLTDEIVQGTPRPPDLRGFNLPAKKQITSTATKPQRKAAIRALSAKNNYNTEEEMAANSRDIIRRAKLSPETKKTVLSATISPEKAPGNQKWASPRARRGKARMGIVEKNEVYEDRCDTEACQNSQDGYTIVGVVVKTGGHGKASTLAPDVEFEGEMDVGDAKRTPLIHWK